MMYRTICTQLWTDKKVQRLTVQGKLLFLYLITNPHTHLAGIYYLPIELIKKETGLSDTLCHTLWDTLSTPAMNLCHYDHENSLVFVVNMFGYQGTGDKNERCAANHLKSLHHSGLIRLFLERYPKVTAFCPDTLSDTLSDTPSTLSKRCPSVPVPVLLVSSPSSDPDLQSKTSTKKQENGSARAGPIPDEWSPNESHEKLARARGLDLAIEAAHFRGKAIELEWLTKSWPQKFTNWMLQEIKFRTRRPT